MSDTLDSLYEELVYLSEVHGELSEEDNALTEKRIAEIQKEIRELECLGSRWG